MRTCKLKYAITCMSKPFIEQSCIVEIPYGRGFWALGIPKFQNAYPCLSEGLRISYFLEFEFGIVSDFCYHSDSWTVH